MKQKPSSRRRRSSTKSILRSPDLEHARAAVLNSLNSADAKRDYRHAIAPGPAAIENFIPKSRRTCSRISSPVSSLPAFSFTRSIISSCVSASSAVPRKDVHACIQTMKLAHFVPGAAETSIDAMGLWLARLRKALDKNYERVDEVLASVAQPNPIARATHRAEFLRNHLRKLCRFTPAPVAVALPQFRFE